MYMPILNYKPWDAPLTYTHPMKKSNHVQGPHIIHLGLFGHMSIPMSFLQAPTNHMMTHGTFWQNATNLHLI